MPGISGLDLLDIDVAPVEQNLAHHAPVLVHLRPDDLDLLAEDHSGKILFRGLPVRLLGFGRVNPLKAYLVLVVLPVQDGDGIAVGDPDHLPLNDTLAARGLRLSKSKSVWHNAQ